MEEINKAKVWKYLNISDGIYLVCIFIGIVFFFGSVVSLIGLWFITFLCSGLGLRRYCKGKSMMMYGTIGDEKADDQEGTMSSYYAHRWTMFLGTIGAVLFTIYHLFQYFN
ncbi:hypothetical protein [Vibrio hepatarius]|uniref:hypothetical protein n=1 Tax=Vibrio hepatarius TaxID=171383 RepID=UPI001C0A231E|nr:hypothetical protein [Vibrio hepatarius]MBU2899003.1 hypothetical protein [Vibrio hepatarius]